jgi:hypothetical protein
MGAGDSVGFDRVRVNPAGSEEAPGDHGGNRSDDGKEGRGCATGAGV